MQSIVIATVLLAFAASAHGWCFFDCEAIRNGKTLLDICLVKLSNSQTICSKSQSIWASIQACTITENHYLESEISHDQFARVERELTQKANRVCADGRRTDLPAPAATTPSSRGSTGRWSTGTGRF